MSDPEAIKYNLQLANRQIQINEWTYNNRMETLFIFQLLFISLLIVAVLMYMKTAGMVGAGFVYYAIGLLMLVVILIIVSRALYTNNTRDPRRWNRRQFGEDGKKESPLPRTDREMLKYLAQLEATYGGPLLSKSEICNQCAGNPSSS